MTLPSARVPTAYGGMHYRHNTHAGGGTPLVMLHGLVIASRYLMPTAERLAPLCPVYAPDLPGYGYSEEPGRVLGFSELTDALVSWLDAAALPRAHFFGNSFGCQLLTDLAVRYPERVDRLVLQGPTMDPAQRTLPRQFWRLVKNSPREPHRLGRLMLSDYWRAGAKRAWRTVRMAHADHIEGRLPRVQHPTLVVRGARDTVVPQRWAEEVTRLLPDARLAVIPGAGHTLNSAAPLELVRVMRPFLGI